MTAARTTTNAAGLAKTLRALKPRLGPEDEALVALARTLAAAVDADPCPDCGAGRTAALWKEYRAAVVALRAVVADAPDAAAAGFLGSVQTPLRVISGDSA